MRIVVLLGDVPLLRKETVAGLILSRRNANAPIAVLTTTPPDVTGYGRIVTDLSGRIDRIVEEKDATDKRRQSGHQHRNHGFQLPLCP